MMRNLQEYLGKCIEMNAELEEEFERTYAIEWNIRKELATEISFLTGIDFKFAFHELTYSPKLAELIKSI